ncbi:OLC1v1035197C1 [Oldenlandia corymbosa var. corymbosa]|uniref:CASP-like protein n=1 Tax=Oldenlandia corymbosa var. corymbosa TaxID=529605 RepID=A0AAV1CVN7_OLDCO|nr:OLC1v1035197C1 [Oldenlandia corymbosa var. corymbosa]
MESLKKVDSILVLRILAILLLVLSVLLIALDSQTKNVFNILVVKASYRDLKILIILVWVDSAAAAYNVLQILRARLLPSTKEVTPALAWICYLMDQAIVYVVFATNSAAIQGAFFAITGQDEFQWMKLCDRFTRFCIQIGGGFLCNMVASIVLAVISCMSACSLFRLYSPKRFLQLRHIEK